MKRLHIHISVPQLEAAVQFYGRMFGAAPSKLKSDYAKWQLDDPRVNFAISTRSQHIGLDHLGIQSTTEEELEQLNARLLDAAIPAGDIEKTTCCYAESVKSWSVDPAGIPWESFVSMQDVDIYGVDKPSGRDNSTCCSGPTADERERLSCC